MAGTSHRADPVSLGSFIRERRRELGLTQTELANRTGFVQERISVMENGKYGMPSLTNLANLAAALEVPLSRLIAAAGYSSEVTPSEAPGTPSAVSGQLTPSEDGARAGVATLRRLIRENDRLAIGLHSLRARLAETEEQMLVADALRETMERNREAVRLHVADALRHSMVRQREAAHHLPATRTTGDAPR